MAKSKLTNCKVCGAEVAKSAKSCPNCGAKLKKGHPILIGILVVIVLIAIIGSMGGNDKPKKVEPAANSQSVDTTAKETVTEDPAQPDEQEQEQEQEQTPYPVEEDKTAFLVGETAELKGVQVTLVGVTESGGSEYNKPSEGNVFVLCEFEIANNSDKEIAISSMMSFDTYCDDYACTISLSALVEKGNKNQLDGTVAAGKKFNGVVGYEVPSNWNELEINFTPDFWSGKDITFIAAKG